MRKITLLLVAVLMAITSAIAGTGWFNDYVKINVNGVGTSNPPTGWYWIGGDPSYATQLPANLGTVSTLAIEGCDMKYWSDSQDRTGGFLYYKIMSADGLTQIVAPVQTAWVQVQDVNNANNYQGTLASNINLLTGLVYGTTYQLQVWAQSTGSGQGDSWLSNSSANYVSTFTYNYPVTITGANGIADGTGYTTLKAAFDAINAQADQTGKSIEIKINSSTTETASAVLNQPATATWNSLKIYPTVSGVTVSGNFANALVDLNGADKVTINGRLNKTGAAKSLTFMQQEATSSLSSTIRLINDAKNDSISYCTIKGSVLSSSSVGGLVYLATALATTGTGNNDNVICYNDFTRAGTVCPLNAFYSNGTSTSIFNARNKIDNNNFFGLFDGTAAQYGVKLGINNAEFTITNNSFYEPNEVIPVAAGNYSPINIGAGTPGEKFNISNNYIGGSEPLCAGLPLRKTNAFSNTVWCMFVSISSTLITNPSNIQGNVIKNISWKNNTSSKKDFTCIQSFGGNMNIGTTAANTISDIAIENGAISTSVFYGINVQNSTSLYTVQNNTISNITISNPDGVNGSSFYGLYKSSSAGEVNFSNNIIGGTAANNINITGTSTANSQLAVGVYVAGNSAAKVTISGNTIRNLNNSSSRTDVTNSTYGVYVNSTAANGTINSNKIYALTASDATLPARVIGINMDVTSASTAITCYNNAISVGNSNPGLVYGILQNTGLAKVDQNSVYIGGSPAIGSFESAALNATGSTAGREFLNNILFNTRSNTGTATSKHYIIKLAASTNLSSNYNAVNSTGTGALLGAIGATDYTTSNTDIQNWVATGLDTNTKVTTVNFTNVASGDLTLTGASIQDANLAVPRLATVLTDFSGTGRGLTTYAGAYEATPYIFTALNPVSGGARITATANGVNVNCSKLSDIAIYTLNGMLLDKVKNTLSFDRSLHAGIYLIKVNNEVSKFIK